MTPAIRNIYIHLSNVIGSESAARIMKELVVCAGGERITIPQQSTLDRIERRQRIQSMYGKHNYSVSNLATIFNVSESTVKKDLLIELFPMTEEGTQ